MATEIILSVKDRASKPIEDINGKVGKLNNSFNALGAAGKGFSRIGRTLTNTITKPALVAGTAVAGIVLKAGFSRFKQIDEAKAKLKALGNDATKTVSIMENARQAVIGTQYNLDEAATTAASAVAAGIKPGKDLTRYLKSVTDASAIAGVSMKEMGLIFNRVSANGKATAMEINMLADRGVPIWQYLAKETGKSVEDVRGDLRAGKIDIKTFRAAIEHNIGGAAKTMGKISWLGAMANFQAAIGRIGANLWGATDDATSVSHALLQAFGEVLTPLETIENKATDIGKRVGQVFSGIYAYMKNGQLGDTMRLISPEALDTIEKLKPAMDKIRGFAQWFSDLSGKGKAAFIGIGLSAGPVFSLIGKGLSLWDKYGAKATRIFTKLGGFKGIFGGVIGILAIGVALFMGLWKNSEAFRGAVTNLVSAIGGLLQPAFEAIKPVITQVGSILKSIFKVAGDMLAPFINLLAKLINWFNKSGTAAKLFKVALWPIKTTLDLIAGAIRTVKSLWDKWKPKSKNFSYNLSPKGLGGGGGNKPEKKDAVGEKSAKGGTTLVGERGPELVEMPKGASVHPARETKQMLGGATVNMPITMTVAQNGLSIEEVVSEISQRLNEAITSSMEGATA